MWPRKQAHASQNRIDSLIGAGTSVLGDVSFTGGLRVDGHVQGNVTASGAEPGTLVVSEQARIDGEIRVAHVVVNGAVNGPITAADHVELQAKARVIGDVFYRTLEIHVGAVIQGRLAHTEQGSASVVELKRAEGN
jgi:cytoskeletal protein CcmA (bactofilin family)